MSRVWTFTVPVEISDFQINWAVATMPDRVTLQMPKRTLTSTIGGRMEGRIARVFGLHPNGGPRSGHKHRGTPKWERRYAGKGKR